MSSDRHRARGAIWLAAALLLPVFAPSAAAQTVPVSASEAVTQPVSAGVQIPANTIVQVELTGPLSSATSQQRDLFELRLVEPIVIDGRELVAAGTLGGGEVIDAKPAGFGGRPGRLIVSARFLEINGQRVPLRGMQLGAAGANHAITAAAVTVAVGIVGLMVEGGETVMPAGTRGTARLAAPVDLSAPSPSSAALESVTQTLTEAQQPVGTNP
jgi:hypothetical protein